MCGGDEGIDCDAVVVEGLCRNGVLAKGAGEVLGGFIEGNVFLPFRCDSGNGKALSEGEVAR